METSEEILNDLFKPKARTRGGELQVAYGRELTAEEVSHLATHPRGLSKPSPLKELRTSHHFLAQLVAQGKKPVEISSLTGTSTSRVSQLTAHDPAFQELVSHYKTQIDDLFIDVPHRLHTIAVDSMEVLHQRLLEKPESFKNEELQKQIALSLDRIGFGPTSKVSVNGSLAVLTDDSLRQIKEEAEARRLGATRLVSDGGRVIDSIPVRAAEASSEAAARREGKGADVREEVHPLSEEESAPGSDLPESVD